MGIERIETFLLKVGCVKRTDFTARNQSRFMVRFTHPTALLLRSSGTLPA